MKDIVIVGAGGFGREVAWLIEEINKKSPEWNIIGFVDDNESIQGSFINHYRVIGKIDWLKDKKIHSVIAISNPLIKQKIFQRLHDTLNQYPVLIHPSVLYSDTVIFGEGTVICAGNILTVNIKIGKHVSIDRACNIGHDAVLGDYSTFLPKTIVSGAVTVEECANIGTGAIIIQGIHIGRNTIVGAGAVVVKDLPADCTAVGIPAKPIKFHKESS